MIPRAEIFILTNRKNYRTIFLLSLLILSKIPVYDENIDDIIGFVHAFENACEKPNSTLKFYFQLNMFMNQI